MLHLAGIRRHREIMRYAERARLQATGELRCLGSRYTPLAARHSLSRWHLPVGGAESRFDTGFLNRDIERAAPDASLCRSASGCRPVSLSETGKADSLTLLLSRAREISSSALLDVRRPPGPGTAALDRCACRSRVAKPDHAPTSKGREHDLIARVVPGRTRGYL